MRMIQHIGFVGLLLAGAGAQLAAQQPMQRGWVVGAALPWATDELKQWTNQSLMGLCLDGAYQIPVSDSSVCFRVGLGFNYLPGKDQYPNGKDMGAWNIGLTAIQVNLDVLFSVGSTPLSVVTGLSLNTWTKSVSGTGPWDPPGGDGSVSGTVKNAFGKYGLRLGAEYALNSRISVALTFQLTELGTDYEFYPDKAGDEGRHAVNPSWLQFGARYKF